jgi:hypothetical protein
MISRKKLLFVLEKARLTEERSIQVYTKHLRSAIFWLGMDKEKARRVQDLMEKLALGSEKHKKMVDDLINTLKKEKKDAF